VNWSEFVPPADLLERGHAIERGLRQYQKLGRFGWALGGAALVIQCALLLAPILERIVPSVATIPWHGSWAALLGNPVVELVLLAAVVGGLLIPVMLRLRLQEAQQPFRYTCSIDPFGPGPACQTHPKLEWLSHDLAQKLGERVGRLKFVDAEEARKRKSDFKESHIHISGAYFTRQRADREDRWFVEVMTRVRVGSMEAADTLAHPVSYPLDSVVAKAKATFPGKLDRRGYDRLLERVYFSVVSELYGEIRKDVERKVDLLPTAYSQAVALYHEARDYARSNTLNGYDAAADLFDRAARSLDVSLRTAPKFAPRRWLFDLRCGVVRGCRGLKLRLAAFAPLFGKSEVLFIRVRNGYARMLLHRRPLAEMSGYRVNQIFKARHVCDAAARRLERVPPDVPDYEDCRFDALVTQALALALLGDLPNACRKLDEARSFNPARADDDPVYLYARGKSEVSPATQLANLQSSIDLADRFHVARFDFAKVIELEWRRHGTLDPTTAESVIARYTDVVAINPANLQAWANVGYVHWLLWPGKDKTDRLTQASMAYESGLEYKEIARKILVSELRFGLARIEAEKGRFDLAFTHLQDAVREKLAEGVSHNASDYTENYFIAMSDKMMERFEAYRSLVLQEKRREADAPSEVLDRVCAFVENDYGAACHNFYLHTGNKKYLGKAALAFHRAVRFDGGFVLAHFNLHQICQQLRSRNADPSAVPRSLRDIEEHAPDWLDGKLIRMKQSFGRSRHLREGARLLRIESDRLSPLAEQAKFELNKVQERLDELLKKREERLKREEHRKRLTILQQDSKDQQEIATLTSWQRQLGDIILKSGAAGKRAKAANKIEQEALNEWRDALRLFRSLVPHKWLHSSRGSPLTPLSDLIQNLIDRNNEFQEAASNEADFNDVHVLALIRLAESLADDHRPSQSRDVPAPWLVRLAESLVDDHRRSQSIDAPAPAEYDGHRVSPSLLISLLELIRKRFYPRDFDLLRIVVDVLRDRMDLGSLKEECLDDFRAVLKETLTADQFYFAAITWLSQTDILGTVVANEDTGLIDYLNRAAEIYGSQQPRIAVPSHDNDGFRRELIFALCKMGRFTPALDLLKVTAFRPGATAGTATKTTKEIYKAAVLAESRTHGSAAASPAATYQCLRQFLESCGKELIWKNDDSGWSEAQSAIFALDQAKLSPSPDTLESASKALTAEAPALWLHPSAIGPRFAEDYFRQSFGAVFARLRREASAEFCFLGDAVEEPQLLLHERLQRNGYLIEASGLAPIFGAVEPDARFCPRLADQFRKETQPLPFVFNPASGAPDGVWIKDRDLAARLMKSGVELWRPEEYVCRHLFFAIRGSLPDFAGCQRVERLLRALRRSAGTDLRIAAEQLMGTSLSALQKKASFIRLLKRLAWERVPIPSLDLPLQTFVTEWRPGCDLLSIAEKIRLLEKARLPGNETGMQLINVPESCLKGLDDHARGRRKADRSPALAIPWALANQLAHDIQANLPATDQGPCAIVVSYDDLRPYVAGLVAAHFPGVAVLAARESGGRPPSVG
jgi:FHIPEP family